MTIDIAQCLTPVQLVRMHLLTEMAVKLPDIEQALSWAERAAGFILGDDEPTSAAAPTRST